MCIYGHRPPTIQVTGQLWFALLQINSHSQPEPWLRWHHLMPAVHKILAFYEKGSILYLVLPIVVLTGVGGDGWLVGREVWKALLLCKLPLSLRQEDSAESLLGHPRFSSTDSGLETLQEMEMHCDFLCPFLLLEPNSKSSFGLASGNETKGKRRC